MKPNQNTVYTPAQTGKARLFLGIGGFAADHKLTYASYAKLTGVSRTLGDSTSVEIPDPDNYNSYIEVDEISGQDSRYTATIVGKYPASIRSLLQYLERCKESFDARLQFGDCENPSDPNSFAKGNILEGIRVTGYSTEDFGALESGEGAAINETLSISFKRFYDFVRMSYFQKGAPLTTVEVKDVFVKQSSRCFGASCDCDTAFAVTAHGASAAPDVLFTVDGGNTWYAKTISSLTASDDALGVADVGDNLVVISTDGLSYTDIQQFYHPGVSLTPTFTKSTTGIVKAPIAIRSTGMKAFISGAEGYIYVTDNPASGVKVLDAGIATTEDLDAIAVYSGSAVVAVGKNGAIVYASDGESFHTSPTVPSPSANYTAVAMRSANEWIVGTATGKLFITFDSGLHWMELFLPGTTPAVINDIVWQGESAGFVAAVVGSGADATARIYRTLDAGANWTVEPAASAGSLPKSAAFNKLATCKLDPNQIFAVGKDSAGTGGMIVVGSDAAG